MPSKKTKKKTKGYSPDIVIVDGDTDSVRCDGGGGALGHPLVWYSFGEDDQAQCTYCDRIFSRKKSG